LLCFCKGFFVFCFDSQLNQTFGVIRATYQVVYGFDYGFQAGLFSAQRLCLFRLIPDGWIFQFRIDFF
jgi:hypothetical protein